MKLNRRKLRKMILKEIRSLNEVMHMPSFDPSQIIDHNGTRYKLSFVQEKHGESIHDIFNIDSMMIVARIRSSPANPLTLEKIKRAIDSAGPAPMYGYKSGTVPRF